MPFHTYDHTANTRLKKDPAIERWAYQRYFGQFGQFKINWNSVKWLGLLYGVIPYCLYQWNESGTRWLDQFRVDDVNAIRFGRTPWSHLAHDDRD